LKIILGMHDGEDFELWGVQSREHTIGKMTIHFSYSSAPMLTQLSN